MGKKEIAFQYILENRKSMIHLWKEMVNTDCGAAYKDGVDRIACLIGDFLEKSGCRVQVIKRKESGNMVTAEYGDTRQNPFIVLIGHMDTVFKKGEAVERPFRIENGKAYGPGVLDMKGGLVILLYAVKALAACGYDGYPLKIILSGDEEINHLHSDAPQVFMKESAGAVYAFNFETGFTDRSIVVQRKGGYQCLIETFGRGCHVGNDPENGRSAILEIAHKVIAIEQLTSFSKGFNINVGVISGGTVPNAAPAYAKIICDLRYTDPEDLKKTKEHLLAITKKQYVPDVTSRLSDYAAMPPMNLLDGTMKLLETARTVSIENGFILPKAKLCGGGSDSAYTTCMGIPTLCAMGVLGARNHTVEEYALVNSLYERTFLMIGILLNLSAKGTLSEP